MADEICRVLLDRPGKGSPMSLIIFCPVSSSFSFSFRKIRKKEKISFFLSSSSPVERNIILSLYGRIPFPFISIYSRRNASVKILWLFIFLFYSLKERKKKGFFCVCVCVPFFFFFFLRCGLLLCVRACVRVFLFWAVIFFHGNKKERNDAAVVVSFPSTFNGRNRSGLSWRECTICTTQNNTHNTLKRKRQLRERDATYRIEKTAFRCGAQLFLVCFHHWRFH